MGGKVLPGKELSHNHLLDLDAAWKAAVSFDRPTICIVKHLSPCGIASAKKLDDAYRAALLPLQSFLIKELFPSFSTCRDQRTYFGTRSRGIRTTTVSRGEPVFAA